MLSNIDHPPEPDQGGAWAMYPQLVGALGIGIAGVKHPLAVEEGSTQNSTIRSRCVTGHTNDTRV
jgi:hypothetical protein